MQRQVLEKNRTAELGVYAVWVPFLGGNEQAVGLSGQVLPDPRVIQYWDGAAATSAWFAKHVERSPGPAWDVFFLYGPDAEWRGIPGPLASSGGTIIGQSSALDKAIGPLLRGTSPEAS